MALSRVVSEIFNVEKCRDLEIGVKGHSRSSKPIRIDPPPIISYLRSMATMGLFRTVSKINDDNRKFFPGWALAHPAPPVPAPMGMITHDGKEK